MDTSVLSGEGVPETEDGSVVGRSVGKRAAGQSPGRLRRRKTGDGLPAGSGVVARLLGTVQTDAGCCVPCTSMALSVTAYTHLLLERI